MRVIAALMVGVLAGCASPTGGKLDDVDLSHAQPACARECLAVYSTCAGHAANALGIQVSNVLDACKASLKSCGDACPRQ